MRITIPNQITLARLVLAIPFFALLSWYDPNPTLGRAWVLAACFWLFLAMALGDVLDGWLARLLRQESAFGRIIDPVVDKVMVCGAFAYFASDSFFSLSESRNVTGVAPWMVVLILTRELLVSSLRSWSEAQGVKFGANWIGKLKMLLQSGTVCVVLGVLAWYPVSLAWLRVACIWATVAFTGYSTFAYLYRARRLLFSAPDAPPAPRGVRLATDDVEMPAAPAVLRAAESSGISA